MASVYRPDAEAERLAWERAERQSPPQQFEPLRPWNAEEAARRSLLADPATAILGVDEDELAAKTASFATPAIRPQSVDFPSLAGYGLTTQQAANALAGMFGAGAVAITDAWTR